MSDSVTHTAPAKGSAKSGKLFRVEEAVATKQNTFIGAQAEADVKPMFFPGVHRSEEQEEVQAKCAECEKEEAVQRHGKHAPEDDVDSEAVNLKHEEEEVQAKCAECEKEEVHKKEEDVQAKCNCEDDSVHKSDLNPQNTPVQNNGVPLPVQTSLKVSQPGDAQEVEADRMGERVMNAPRLSFTGGGGVRPDGNNNISRSEEEDVQRSEDEEVQSKSADGLATRGLTTSDFSARLKAAGPGQPLPAKVRVDMEENFNADFSDVRIHTGTEAAGLSDSINAQAFAYRHNIFFNDNKFQPGSPTGRFLLAHELTHTVQQGAAPVQQKVARTEEKKEEQKVARKEERQEIARTERKGEEQVTRKEEKEEQKVARLETTPPTIQRDDDDDDESWWDKLKNGAEWVLRKVLPESVYQFYLDVKKDGLFGFIKRSLMSLFLGLFKLLGFKDVTIDRVVKLFSELRNQLPGIMDGLAKGDCQPLFTALGLLGEIVKTIAGDIWDRVMETIEPIRQWLKSIWDTYLAPALDKIAAFAGELWDKIKDLGRWIWNKFYDIVIKPFKDAWDWICDKLGIGGDGGDSEGGFLSWVGDKLSEAWNWVKEQLRPVIEPIANILSSIGSLISWDAIKRMQERAAEWLNAAAAAASSMNGEDDAVAKNQLTLRGVLIPALNNAIDAITGLISAAGDWIVEKVNTVTGYLTGFFDGIRNNEYLSFISPLLSWIPSLVTTISGWATDGVKWIFDKIVGGMGYVKDFMQRVLDMLLKLVDAVGDMLGHLGDFILGPLNLVPDCIKNPIINWVTEKILKHIPIIAEFIELKDKWPSIKAAALLVIKQIFVDGQLARGLWTFFKNLLGLIGIDASLVVAIIAKAATNFSKIIMHPLDFLGNVFRTITGGFGLFFDHIGKNLLTGALDWLFGEVKGASGVAKPKDFSLSSILGYVMDLFGITKENMYKRMEENPKIGPKKVAKIRQMENALTGALEWITVWIKEGPAGLLRMATEKLSDLINVVVDSVINWITGKISAEIMKRLATSADPLGIGATINAIILLYQSLKAAIDYINKVLNLANQAMDNLAEIIAGQLEHAKQAFEDVLIGAVPVVIGFAVEALLGDVSEKIREIIADVRKKVDEAIDWLINGALSLIDTLISAGKAAVNAVLGWLGLRKQFKAEDGETHTLSFQGTAEHSQLMIASSIQAFTTWLDAIDIPAPTSEKGKKLVAHRKEAKKVYAQIETIKNKKIDAKYTEDMKTSEMKQALDDLSAEVGPLFSSNLPDCSTFENHGVTYYPVVAKSDFGTKMEAATLTRKKAVMGTKPSISSPEETFRTINQRRNGDGSYYILGHLLNMNLGGSGTTMENLTPITGSANTTHESQAEHNVKEAVTAGNIVEYSVTAQYNRSKSTAALKKKVDDDPNVTEDKNEIKKIIDAEVNVTTGLDVKAYLVDPSTNKKTRFLERLIPNVIDQSPMAYDLTGVKPPTIYLDTNKPTELKQIPPPDMDDTLAALIIKARKHREKYVGRFDSKESLKDYEIDGKPVFNAAQKKQLKKIFGMPNVKLYDA
jgi:hypothetical protein